MPTKLRRVRLLLWIAVAITAAAAGGLFLLSPKPQSSTSASEWKTGVGGPFTLVGTDGQPFPSSRLAGKPFAIFFGFTNCPDVCPTTLARLVKLRAQIGSSDKLSIVFVTVDPERDGPAQVANYVKLFDSPVIGLTGSPAQIAHVKKQFAIFSEKHGQGANYSVDHTATVLLFDRAGQLQATIAPDEPDSSALDKLKRLTS
jgi:protein SCO1